MPHLVKIHWSERPAALVHEGPEQSVIEWLDTGIQQAISTNQFDILEKVTHTEADKHKKPKTPKQRAEGPSKQERVTEIVKANPTASRQELIKLVVAQVGMTPAGAGTYVYNAKQILKGE